MPSLSDISVWHWLHSLADDFAVGTDMLAVMAAEASVEVVVAEIVGMGLPVQLHLGEGCVF